MKKTGQKTTLEEALKHQRTSPLAVEGYIVDAEGFVQQVIIDLKIWKQFLKKYKNLTRQYQ